MGGYRSSEYGNEDNSSAVSTNNQDRAQTTLGSIQSDDGSGTVVDNSDGSLDGEIEAINNIEADEDIDDESLENIREGLEKEAARGNIDEESLSDISISQSEGPFATSVQAWTDSDGDVYETGEKNILVGDDGADGISQEEADRLAARVTNVNNNALHESNTEVLQTRNAVQSSSDPLETAWSRDKAGRKMVADDGTTESSYNDFWESAHDNRRVICGARDDKGRFSSDADNMMASMHEELESEGFNGGTNEWQYGAEAMHDSIENNNIEPNQEWKEYVDTMSIAAGKTDSIADSPWENGETVFGEVTEENYEDSVESVRGRVQSNAFEGAGTSRNLSQDIEGTVDDN